MNSVITLPRLVDLVATAANCDRQVADLFVHRFFDQIRENLALSEIVKIKGIGTFRITESREIAFVPEASMAEAVNAPFSCFTPVELAPDFDLPDSPTEVPADTTETRPPKLSASDKTEAPADKTEAPADKTEAQPPKLSDSGKTEAPADITEAQPPKLSASDTTEAQPPELSASDTTERSGKTILATFMAIIGLLIGVAIGFFLHDPIQEAIAPLPAKAIVPIETIVETESEDATDTEQPAVEPEQEQEPAPQTEPAQVVKDTVTTTRFLATMAREHYGQTAYWVYIYLENEERLGNPNTVAPGTEVVIPPIEKYATQPTLDERLDAAQRLADEILTKYNR